ncbi:MAG: S66 peptidase family protein [Armatimonadaceae bacterium]
MQTIQPRNIRWPRALPKGGTIGICSPAGPSKPGSIAIAADALRSRGYEVVIAPNAEAIHSDFSYLAGGIDARVSDLNSFFQDANIDAIVAARGGYGSAQLLPYLDYTSILRDPKPLVGYSDITSLNLGILAQTGITSFSGIMCTAGDGFGQASLDAFSAQSFFDAISSLTETGGVGVLPTPDGTQLGLLGARPNPSTVTGRLIPVCMSLLVEAIGTPYIPDLTGAILVLEDIGEDVYSIDRMFNHLKLAGILNRVNAVVLGSFNTDDDSKNIALIEKVPLVADMLVPQHIPIYTGYPYGHIPRRLTLPVGPLATMDTATGAVTFTQ